MSDEGKEHEDDHDEPPEVEGEESTTTEAPEKPKPKPAWCAVTRIERRGADGTGYGIDEPCRVLSEGAPAWEERFKRIDAATMAQLWGGGVYRVQHHYKNGKIARKDAPLDIPGPSKPADCDLTPKKPEPEPEPAPPARSAEPASPLSLLPPEMAQLAPILSVLDFFESRAQKRVDGQVAMIRAQSEAYIKQLETLQAGALAREQARSEQALKEQEARHKRDREHLADLAKQTREATDLDAVLARVQALEEQDDEPEPEWLKRIPDLVTAAMKPRPGERR